MAGELACGTCAAVRKAVASAFGDCLACCSTVLDWRSTRRYDTAVLRVPSRDGAGFPGVAEFIEKAAAAEFQPELSIEGDGASLVLRRCGTRVRAQIWPRVAVAARRGPAGKCVSVMSCAEWNCCDIYPRRK